MIVTPEIHREAAALLMLIEAGADGAMVAQQAQRLITELGGTRDLRTLGPTAVPMYIATLLFVRMLGH
jgi:hypothetical protein